MKWPMGGGPQHFNDVLVLSLIGYLQWRAVQTVKEGGVGETVKEVLDRRKVTLTTRKKERGLTLWTGGKGRMSL